MIYENGVNNKKHMLTTNASQINDFIANNYMKLLFSDNLGSNFYTLSFDAIVYTIFYNTEHIYIRILHIDMTLKCLLLQSHKVEQCPKYNFKLVVIINSNYLKYKFIIVIWEHHISIPKY